MNQPATPESPFLSGMMGMMPNLMAMMGMMPGMMGMMQNPMGGTPGGTPNPMAAMMGMLPMLCRMTLEVGTSAVTCTITPMDGASMDALRERCEAMAKTMGMGLPMAVACGGQMLIGTPGIAPGTPEK